MTAAPFGKGRPWLLPPNLSQNDEHCLFPQRLIILALSTKISASRMTDMHDDAYTCGPLYISLGLRLLTPPRCHRFVSQARYIHLWIRGIFGYRRQYACVVIICFDFLFAPFLSQSQDTLSRFTVASGSCATASCVIDGIHCDARLVCLHGMGHSSKKYVCGFR